MAFINVVSSMSFEKILKGKEKNLWVKREMLARQTGPSHRHSEQGHSPNVFNISTNWLAWMKGRQFNITMICLQKFIKQKEKTCESKAKGRPARQLICPCRPCCCFVVCYCYCCCLIKTTCEAKARGWPDRHVLPPVVKRKTPNAEAASHDPHSTSTKPLHWFSLH